MGSRLRRQLSVATRRELIEAVAARYRAGGREEKKELLDEFVKVTGFHRKHAIRVLRKSPRQKTREPRQRRRIYDEAVREALTIAWEAAGRICGKRLHEAIAGLVAAMGRHGHLGSDAGVRKRLLSMNAATMDRLLQTVRETGKQGRRKSGIRPPLRKSIAVPTFGDWNDPPPGYFEMDMVANRGESMAGSHVHSLVLTDTASGWREAVAMIVRDAGWMPATTAHSSTIRRWAIAGATNSNSLGVSVSRVPEERSGLDRAEQRRGGPANGRVWEAGGRAAGGGLEQVVRLRAAVRKLLPTILQADFEDAGWREDNQEVPSAGDAMCEFATLNWPLSIL
jgi:hypothetical protein